MNTKHIVRKHLLVAGLSLLGISEAIAAPVIIKEDFTGTTTQNSWYAQDGACLTAGSNSGSIPACVGLPYYSGQTQWGGTSGTLPDSPPDGALRLTNGSSYYHQDGAIISNFPFSMSQGVQVTFTTVTYHGDSGGSGHDGADGLSFFLMDTSKPQSIGHALGSGPLPIGSWGGSLGYSCSNSNSPYTGMVGGYVGLGIDEYGNFLNPSDNTSSGPGYQWNRIGLRGPGNIAWNWLNYTYPSYYPSTLTTSQKNAAVQKTCETGTLWNYTHASSPSNTGTTVMDYPALPNGWALLPSGTQIANESTTKRPVATPISYKLKITSAGKLSTWYSINGGTLLPILTNQDITTYGAIPANVAFGFAGSTGGSDNIHEITCFAAGPGDISASSAGINVQQTGKVQIGTQVYLAFYNPDDWLGSVTSNSLLVNSTTYALTVNPTANWDASCVLTGASPCQSTGTAVTAESPTSRTIMTYSGSQGIPFEWGSLTSSQQTALNLGDSLGQNRLNYLRGVRSQEGSPIGSGPFRVRDSVLGDVIDSSPTWVGAPAIDYPTSTANPTGSWQDLVDTTAPVPEAAGGAPTYGNFEAANATREDVVYDGANDGMLHGFRAGSYDTSGNFVSNGTTPNDGYEVLAYFPTEALQQQASGTYPANEAIHNSVDATYDYSSPNYGHNYFVDATPGTGDLFYNNAWHTWLVSGLGAGGMSIFALDITNPTSFTETNAANIVIGEWSPTQMSHLGQTYGTPIIRRFHNGEWGIVLGNGFNSASGHAGIYIMLVGSSTGQISSSSIYFLDTNTGTSTTPDGIAYVTAADLDGDHIVDYLYAGDIFGNVWRFDVTSSNPTNWTSATPVKIFSTAAGQPITTQVQVFSVPQSTGSPFVLVEFGTGQATPQTHTAPVTYATASPQSIYGIWDWQMSNWNSLSSTKYAFLSTGGVSPIAPGNLQMQTVTTSTSTTGTGGIYGYRTLSSNTVCWQGSTACTSGDNKFGWELDLPTPGEQVVYNPTLAYGTLFVNTTIPPGNTLLNCSQNTTTGWTMAINAATGGSPAASVFPNPTGTTGVLSGAQLNLTGTPAFVTVSANNVPVAYLGGQTSSGQATFVNVNSPGGGQSGRINWIQLR